MSLCYCVPQTRNQWRGDSKVQSAASWSPELEEQRRRETASGDFAVLRSDLCSEAHLPSGVFQSHPDSVPEWRAACSDDGR